VCSMVLYFTGCSTPSVLKSVTDPNYQPTYNDGFLIGSALWGGEAAYGLVGGYLVGDFLYHSLSGASSSSDGSMQFLEGYPRQIEAQYLARLDETRQIISAPLDDAIPDGTTNWNSALYYAIRPEAQNIRAENFDSSTYAVDLDAGTVEILPAAYEAEPYTGTVIVKHTNSEQRLVAYVNRGIMAETGSLWDLNGTKRLRNKYDENGTLRESGAFDGKGTFARATIYDENGTLGEFRNYDENGTLRLSSFYDENGSVKEDHIYYDSGIVSQRRMYEEDGSVETNQFFDEKGKRDIRKEGSILISDVRIKIVRLNLYPNPTQDSVMQIYDQDELAIQEFPFAFTGKVLEFYDEERKIKKRQEEIKEGLYDGISIWWHKNGTKQFEAEFVKGVLQGSTAWYRKDGSVEYEGEWKDSKLVSASTWNINGQQIVGDDGQTSLVIDGEGKLIYQHPNGQKRLEETYADGKLTENKFWDEAGNPVESVDPSFIPAFRRVK
jgi:antitoxin component YwqK of YwqJK toxin-antitoxin module